MTAWTMPEIMHESGGKRLIAAGILGVYFLDHPHRPPSRMEHADAVEQRERVEPG